MESKSLIKKAFVFIFFVIALISFVNQCSKTTDVVDKEFNANALLKKYEYFKDLSSAIDKKRADIEMYKELLKSSKTDDKEYIQQKESELIGIISIHNSLCSEYNSAMSKFNYRFCNVGGLPQTNLEPLPREIKPYINTIK